jgi:hypothetical protein
MSAHHADLQRKSGTSSPVPNLSSAANEVAATPLHDYLVNRYADSVIRTFAQLEDLLGCALPDSARVQHEWWTSMDKDAGQSSRSDAWILAGRTARPNLLARMVAFERRMESHRDSRSVE